MMVAGFGFRVEASLESLRAALRQALAHCGIEQGTAQPLVLVASAQDKAAAACLRALAASLNVPVCAVPPGAMACVPTLTHSAPVRARRGTGSVAEASALAAAKTLAGDAPRLLHPRVVSPDRLATCAIASFTSSAGTFS